MEQVYSFSHQMESIGLAPSSELLEFKIVKKDEVLANLFGIKDIEPVYKIVRLRKANGDPLLLETTFIPAKYHPGLDANKLVDGSLYDMLRDDAKILPHTAEETYESIVFEKHISNLLKCAQRSSGFYIERITRMESGEIYELTQSFMRGDRSKIAIKLQQDVYTFNRSIE
jgi:GntR family transcriptional regulator